MNPELVKIIIEGFKLVYELFEEVVDYLDTVNTRFEGVKDKLEALRVFVEEGPDFSEDDDV